MRGELFNLIMDSRDTDTTDILTGIDDLLEPFYQAEKPRSEWRIGIEAEKFGVYAASGTPLTYYGSQGVQAIFHELCERYGWSEVREFKEGDVIALQKDDASITLEPGAQLEFSGSPLKTVHEICDEFRGHMAEIRSISRPLGIVWFGLGFHPFAKQEDLIWVPKLRYSIMREYLPSKGARALDMMRRTGTVQANADYESEADAIRKVRVALAIQPIVTALFANSPFIEKRIGERLSERAQVWLDVDKDRCGILPFAWEEDFSYRRYVEWALDVPMFLIKRGDTILKNTGQTFRSFLKEGFQGVRAAKADWTTHLRTLFPEVRLTNTIEVRGADAQAISLVCALPALWKGIFYDEQALGETERLISPLNAEELEKVRPEIAKKALRARVGNRLVLEWATEIVEIAHRGLKRLGHLNSKGEDETIHLNRLRRLVRSERTPAEALLAEIDPAIHLQSQLIARACRPSAINEVNPSVIIDGTGDDRECP
jgi:glutamate--cysteine ligase